MEWSWKTWSGAVINTPIMLLLLGLLPILSTIKFLTKSCPWRGTWQCWHGTCPWRSISSLYVASKPDEQLIHGDCRRHRSSESDGVFFALIDYDFMTISMTLIDSYLWWFLGCLWPTDNIMYQNTLCSDMDLCSLWYTIIDHTTNMVGVISQDYPSSLLATIVRASAE